MTNFESIESLFALLREHLQRNPGRFEVEYDQVLGYPTRADLDLSSQVADDELRFEITEFKLAR